MSQLSSGRRRHRRDWRVAAAAVGGIAVVGGAAAVAPHLTGHGTAEHARQAAFAPPGDGGGGSPVTIKDLPNGDQLISYTDANGNSYSFTISAAQQTQAEQNVMEKLNQGLERAGQYSAGPNKATPDTGYEYVPVLRAQGPTPDLLRLRWDHGLPATPARVDIKSPAPGTSARNIFDTLNQSQSKGQCEEAVVDLEGRDLPSIMDVVTYVGGSFETGNDTDLQKLNGVRFISDAQTNAPPTLDATVVRAAGATTDPAPLGLGGVTVTGDAVAENAQAAVVDAAAAQLPPQELPVYETPEQ